MSLARMLPTSALVGVMALVLTPVAVALFKMGPQPQSSSSQKKSTTSTKPVELAGFKGERAYEYLVEQCKIGPRISGTDGNRALRKRMAEHFESQGAKVTLQTFVIPHPQTGEPVEMENVVASWFPDRKNRVVIGAHFDTRPRPDKESTPKKRAQTFLGANDGASGVAVLMELANMMKDLKTTVGVDLVAFDGEELVWEEGGKKSGEFFEGSTHFAQQYRQAQKSGSQSRYIAGVVVDMVGGNVLRILPDERGKREAPQLVQEVWSVARRLKANGFGYDGDYDVSDDHWPLLDVGIPAIDIIDFNYKHWHLASDTADKCSAASLAQVGGVVAEWLRGK